jgi:hypothetical protein
MSTKSDYVLISIGIASDDLSIGPGDLSAKVRKRQ